MAVIVTTLKQSQAKVTTQDNKPIDDIVTLTKGVGEADGFTIITNSGNVFIPNDITDRQAIIDTTIELVNTLSSTPLGSYVNSAGLPTNIVTNPDLVTGLNQIKTNLQSIKNNLK